MKRHAPAAGRNAAPIADVLAAELPDSGLVLEIASGTGEHAVFNAARFPAIDWQPSDRDAEAMDSIASWVATEGHANLRPPIMLDVCNAHWPVARADAVLCINMVHISPWAATQALFSGAAQVLSARAPLVLYGPYFEDAVETAASNLAFDADLQRRNPDWGLRRIEDVDALASEHGFRRSARYSMPANNLILVYRQGSNGARHQARRHHGNQSIASSPA